MRPRPGAIPFVLGAETGAAVRDAAARLADALQDDPGIRAIDVGHSLAAAPASFAHRAVVIGGEREDLLEGLRSLARAEPSARVVEGVADPGLGAGEPVFVFSGHGGQWDGMALALWDGSAVFAAAMEECAAALGRYVDWSLEDVLRRAPGAPALDRVDVVQPALFAIMVSLARLWRSFGVTPAAVVGHSQGEIAAAHVAGALSLDDAARVVALRSRALGELLSGRGGMVSVSASVAEVERYLEPFAGRLSVATSNGPAAVGVSGEPPALDELLALCDREGIRARRVAIDYAAHSAQVEVLRERLLADLAPIAPQTARVPLVSTLTGDELDTAAMDAEYWYRSERETVRFAPAVAALLHSGRRTFIEIGPHPVLTVPIEGIAEELGHGIATVATLRRDQGGPERFLASLAALYVRGGEVDWGVAFEGRGAQRVALPEPAPAVAATESSFAARVAGMPAGERRQVVLDAVRGEAAAVLGHASAAGVDARSTFKELGFDSPAIVELRNRVNALTGLRLASGALFDVPTPARLADRVLAEITGGAQAPARAPRARGRADEPIAIVGIACRYPGGVGSPDELWELVSTGRDAIGEFPANRGWDMDRLFDPDGGVPARRTSATAASCTARATSTPATSGSRRARRWRWIRSSDCCSSAPGRRWRPRGSTPRACAAATPACSPG